MGWVESSRRCKSAYSTTAPGSVSRVKSQCSSLSCFRICKSKRGLQPANCSHSANQPVITGILPAFPSNGWTAHFSSGLNSWKTAHLWQNWRGEPVRKCVCDSMSLKHRQLTLQYALCIVCVWLNISLVENDSTHNTVRCQCNQWRNMLAHAWGHW